LDAAIAGFQKAIGRKESDPDSAMPWTADGPRWHKSSKGFPPGRKVHWDLTVLDRVMACLEEASPAPRGTGRCPIRSSDGSRTSSKLGAADDKLPRGLELNLVGPKGAFNLAAIERFGRPPAPGPSRKMGHGKDRLPERRRRFGRAVRRFPVRHAEAFRGRFARGG